MSHLEQEFETQRQALLDFITKEVRPTLRKVSSQLGHVSEKYDLPTESLNNCEFKLVIVGAYQSGKSTLFNYMCDGRELVRTGSGTRTSSGRVNVHVSKDGREKAIITWCTKEELQDILSKTDLNGDLSDSDERKRIKDEALKVLRDPEESLGEKIESAMRTSALIAEFYPEYMKRCKVEREECPLTEAISKMAYPKDWGAKWRRIVSDNESCADVFTFDEVAFIFCNGVDMHIKADNLGDIGCSIEDCPGLFVSDRDDKLAETCIQHADMVLYTFEAKKEMGSEEYNKLKELFKSGPFKDLADDNRVIFGANLHTSRNSWKNEDIENSYLDNLKKLGFKIDHIYDYHAALALRTVQLQLLKSGELKREYVSSLEGKSESGCEDFLTNDILKFVRNLEDNQRITIDRYQDNLEQLEKLSRVPAFINSARDRVFVNKARYVLNDQGTQKVLDALCRAKEDVNYHIDSLSKKSADAKKDAEEQRRKVELFDQNYREARRKLAEAGARVEEELPKYLRNRIHDILYTNEFLDGLAQKTYDLTSTWLDAWNPSKQAEFERKNEFMNMLKKIVSSHVQKKLLDGSNEDIAKLSSVSSLKEIFDDSVKTLSNEIKELDYMPQPGNVGLKSFSKEAFMSNEVWNALGEVFRVREQGFGSVVIDVFTLGGARLVRSERDRAKNIVSECMKVLESKLKDELERSLHVEKKGYTPAGMLRNIKDTYDDFNKAFSEPKRIEDERQRELADRAQNTEKENKEKMKFLQRIASDIENHITRCEQLKEKAEDTFSASIA